MNNQFTGKPNGYQAHGKFLKLTSNRTNAN